MHVWTKRCREENLDAWVEVLSELPGVDPKSVVATRNSGRIWHKVEIFAETPAELDGVSKLLGGLIREVADQSWVAGLRGKRGPIRIRDRFLIVEQSGGGDGVTREIIIPAGMAFGTGDHPTTAACLRLLVDVAEGFTPEMKWSLLDVGTGSGVLAIAGKLLEAEAVEAFDFDPNAIRTAQENARLNNVTGIEWSVGDVLKFDARTSFDVVAANIYSELFREAWSRLEIAIKPGGAFLLSGILRLQAPECEALLKKSGFTISRKITRGKWVALVATK